MLLFYKNIFEMIIENFKKWMIFNRNFSLCTVNNYMRSVENFDEYLSRYDRGVEECEEIKISEVEGRLAFEKMTKDSNTCNNYLA
jgi:site-specific recombinase XerD